MKNLPKTVRSHLCVIARHPAKSDKQGNPLGASMSCLLRDRRGGHWSLSWAWDCTKWCAHPWPCVVRWRTLGIHFFFSMHFWVSFGILLSFFAWFPYVLADFSREAMLLRENHSRASVFFSCFRSFFDFFFILRLLFFVFFYSQFFCKKEVR